MQLDKTNESVGQMFNEIAPTYDLLNHLLSFNCDKKWRKKAVSFMVAHKPRRVLDIATGTGDMIIHYLKNKVPHITGIDIAEQMIQLAKEKVANQFPSVAVDFNIMSAENLLFNNNTFDAVSVAFGVRNFENIDRALNEIHRVIHNDGIFVVLEFVKPNRLAFAPLQIYLKYILPLIGKFVSKNRKAYTYLYQSIKKFYKASDFVKLCEQHQFRLIKTHTFFFGLVAIFVFKK